MSKQPGQGGPGTGPADVTLALAVAGALHPPTGTARAPRTADARRTGARKGTASRGRRRAARG
ncbi:hypothetical protein SZN_12663 [Streptomyces zinciresistens K42]|uniref:Uncharacterized protein n=1 Tax=Streptomyces zinciresistens K42 TaxID=700597 RepID=G2GAL0_9ACTN|nr:hypothetical protein [Streptomyces zinciresistens]EGX59457.1 hypothetical protein SZN_12663 [Streptomyces zinciresistens K42]